MLSLKHTGVAFDPQGPGRCPQQFPRALERVLDTNDLMGMHFFEQGLRVSRAVGRIHIRDSGGDTLGYGTGFLVSSLAPQDLFLSDEQHDYALVAVAPEPGLAAYGWLPLIEDQGRVRETQEPTTARESALNVPTTAMLNMEDFQALQERLSAEGAGAARERVTDLISDHMIDQYLLQIGRQLGRNPGG